ncbi:response regulator [Permianibacter sp. IMCC34836]|uniref:response regulator n=1 Tax=Permianibacter fluminis TaxID=2738515 RepID=UPI001551A60E|nr:response regulator [Permianibacter fluminis]NQD37867.1 response regulator [Permianibacter fluminis]
MTELLPLIVLIEDELPIRRFLRASLTPAHYRMEEAGTGVDGLKTIAREKPEIVILDLGLPDIDGVQLIRQLREWSDVPIIILSARDQEVDKVAALDAGADDYLVKPFSVPELEARLRVAIRHRSRIPGAPQQSTFKMGDISVDLAARTVSRGSEPVHLTKIEFKLLTQLIKHSGMVVTHRHLLKEVWGPSHIEDSHYLRIYMGQLRHKLEQDPAQPRYLRTELGVGYRLVADA